MPRRYVEYITESLIIILIFFRVVHGLSDHGFIVKINEIGRFRILRDHDSHVGH